jgi:hypothetical protein
VGQTAGDFEKALLSRRLLAYSRSGYWAAIEVATAESETSVRAAGGSTSSWVSRYREPASGDAAGVPDAILKPARNRREWFHPTSEDL